MLLVKKKFYVIKTFQFLFFFEHTCHGHSISLNVHKTTDLLYEAFRIFN